MKVIKEFYCIKTKVSYKKGDEYNGNRKDIDSYLDIVKPIVKKPTQKKVKK